MTTLLALAAGACAAEQSLAADGGPCLETRPVVSADGGVFPCLRADTCPRPSNVFVCVSTSDDREQDCVSCADTRCVRTLRRCPP